METPFILSTVQCAIDNGASSPPPVLYALEDLPEEETADDVEESITPPMKTNKKPPLSSSSPTHIGLHRRLRSTEDAAGAAADEETRYRVASADLFSGDSIHSFYRSVVRDELEAMQQQRQHQQERKGQLGHTLLRVGQVRPMQHQLSQGNSLIPVSLFAFAQHSTAA